MTTASATQTVIFEATSAESIRSAVSAAGIVGMGGGGFPTHVKLDAQVDSVIANGAECEPLLWSDKALVLHHADEVADGLVLAMEATGAARGYLGVKEAYPDVVAGAEAAVRRVDPSGSRLSVARLANVYPAGDEFTLVQQVLGRTISETALPLSQGVVVSNVASLAAVSAAVRSAVPSTERFVTVTGYVQRPGVYQVPVGTRLSDVVAAAGGTDLDEPALVTGGPMMGRLAGADDSVSKTTSGLLVLPDDHHVVRARRVDPLSALHLARAACCACGECTEVCPRNLLGHRIFPDRLMRGMASGLTGDVEAYAGAMLCCECGLCTEYGCPMGLDPRGMNIEVKRRLGESGFTFQPKAESTPSSYWRIKQVPVPRLTARLGLSDLVAHLDLAGRVDPGMVRIAVQQGAGAAPKVVVEEGQQVRVGQVLAEPTGRISAALHASIPGRIERIESGFIVIRRAGGSA